LQIERFGAVADEAGHRAFPVAVAGQSFCLIQESHFLNDFTGLFIALVVLDGASTTRSSQYEGGDIVDGGGHDLRDIEDHLRDEPGEVDENERNDEFWAVILEDVRIGLHDGHDCRTDEDENEDDIHEIS